MPKLVNALLVALLSSSPTVCVSKTPWGEKDETDSIQEARTFHIMFLTEREAANAKQRLAGKNGKALFAAFQALARAESKDAGSAPRGGDLGVVQEGVMVRSFEDALFSLPPRTVSNPIKSEFGWHLIYAYDYVETPVKQVCADTLSDALKQSDDPQPEGLAQADELPLSADYAQRIERMIGDGWGRPLKDWNGDLAFIRILPSPESTDRSKALMHIEFTKASLSTAPKGCKRSARQEYEINCSAKLAAPTARFEYEGRGASGRVLHQFQFSAAERKKYASGVGFHGQLIATACEGTPIN